jgi:hypothetical protein
MPENGQNEKIDTISEWVKAVRSVSQIRIGKIRRFSFEVINAEVLQ